MNNRKSPGAGISFNQLQAQSYNFANHERVLEDDEQQQGGEMRESLSVSCIARGLFFSLLAIISFLSLLRLRGAWTRGFQFHDDSLETQYFGLGFENHTRELTRWEASRFRGDVIKLYNQPPSMPKEEQEVGEEQEDNMQKRAQHVKEITKGGAALDLPGFRLNVIVPERVKEISSMDGKKVSRLSGRGITSGAIPRRRLSSKSYSNAAVQDKVLGKQQRERGLMSPSNGTDIMSHPSQLIKCHNQTVCIQPALQLTKVFNVYYCKHIGYGVRFYYLVREGLLLHPSINMIEDPFKADMVVYLPVSADWDKTECNNPKLRNKTIILDEGDYQQLFEPGGAGQFLGYFKRSFVNRQNGKFLGYMDYLKNPLVLPMTYIIAEAYIKTQFNLAASRDYELVCTLRGGAHDPTRLRVREWVEQYARARGLKKFVAGEVNGASRTVVSTGYLDQMHRAQIIVTSNPSGWEGDFRLMEAMASGALVLVDRMYVPRPFPLIHGKHILYYDNNNKSSLFDLLDKYRASKEMTRRVAVAGYLHAMKFHRAASLLDYVFRTIHCKIDHLSCRFYTQTGFEMRKKAIDKELL